MTEWPLSYCTLDRSPLFGLRETLHEQIDAAARVGFAYVTPDMFSLRAYVETHGSVEPLAELISARGLRVCDIAGCNVSADRDASIAEATELAGYARTLGAAWVQSRITAPLDPPVLDTYRRCAEITAEAGAAFGLEFSPFTPVDGLGRAREVLAQVRDAAPGQAIVVDTWHLSHTDGVEALAATSRDEIAFIQISDTEHGADCSTAATMHHRALPGEGDIGLHGYVRALRSIGFDGIVTVEVLSASLRALDTDEYARRAHDSTRAVLDAGTHA
ncbi:MAG TPA: sugar phosphate isomerase/epimerase [Acidimicrobiales bacterium]